VGGTSSRSSRNLFRRWGDLLDDLAEPLRGDGRILQTPELLGERGPLETAGNPQEGETSPEVVNSQTLAELLSRRSLSFQKLPASSQRRLPR
jgi:hypothetical protein